MIKKFSLGLIKIYIRSKKIFVFSFFFFLIIILLPLFSTNVFAVPACSPNSRIISAFESQNTSCYFGKKWPVTAIANKPAKDGTPIYVEYTNVYPNYALGGFDPLNGSYIYNHNTINNIFEGFGVGPMPLSGELKIFGGQLFKECSQKPSTGNYSRIYYKTEVGTVDTWDSSEPRLSYLQTGVDIIPDPTHTKYLTSVNHLGTEDFRINGKVTCSFGTKDYYVGINGSECPKETGHENDYISYQASGDPCAYGKNCNRYKNADTHITLADNSYFRVKVEGRSTSSRTTTPPACYSNSAINRSKQTMWRLPDFTPPNSNQDLKWDFIEPAQNTLWGWIPCKGSNHDGKCIAGRDDFEVTDSELKSGDWSCGIDANSNGEGKINVNQMVHEAIQYYIDGGYVAPIFLMQCWEDWDQNNSTPPDYSDFDFNDVFLIYAYLPNTVQQWLQVQKGSVFVKGESSTALKYKILYNNFNATPKFATQYLMSTTVSDTGPISQSNYASSVNLTTINYSHQINISMNQYTSGYNNMYDYLYNIMEINSKSKASPLRDIRNSCETVNYRRVYESVGNSDLVIDKNTSPKNKDLIGIIKTSGFQRLDQPIGGGTITPVSIPNYNTATSTCNRGVQVIIINGNFSINSGDWEITDPTVIFIKKQLVINGNIIKQGNLAINNLTFVVGNSTLDDNTIIIKDNGNDNYRSNSQSRNDEPLPDVINAYFITDGNIKTEADPSPSGKKLKDRLYIYGGVISTATNLNSLFSASPKFERALNPYQTVLTQYPAELIEYDPSIIITMRNILGVQSRFTLREVGYSQ